MHGKTFDQVAIGIGFAFRLVERLLRVFNNNNNNNSVKKTKGIPHSTVKHNLPSVTVPHCLI